MKYPPRAENIYSQPYGDTEETEHTKPDISPKANKYPEPVDSLSPHKTVAICKTILTINSSGKQNPYSDSEFNVQPLHFNHERFQHEKNSLQGREQGLLGGQHSIRLKLKQNEK